jgi:betaine-aldehyde dehydrogenase
MRNQLYIDGTWLSPAKGGSFDVINPATEEVIHHAPAGTAEVTSRVMV